MGYKLVTNVVGFNDTNINAKNTGSTVIFTTLDSTKLFFPYKIRIFGANLSGVVAAPTISIGTNASSFNNILASTALTTLTTQGTFIDFAVLFPEVALSAGTAISVNVTGGANATTYGIKIGVYGDTI